MKWAWVALLLVGAPQDPADFPQRKIAYEREIAEFLRADALRLLEKDEVEAAQVFANLAGWIQPDSTAIGDLEKKLRDKVVALTMPQLHQLEVIRPLVDGYSDSLRMGPVGRLALDSAPLRRDRTKLTINLGSDKVYIQGDTYSFESDRGNLRDFDPPAWIFAFNDELLVCEKGKIAASPLSEAALRAGREGAIYRKVRAISLEAATHGRTEDATKFMVLSEMLFTLRHAVRALWRLNDHRIACKQKPAAYSAQLSFGCFLHARYLSSEKPENVEGLKAHQEGPTSKWFTNEGFLAGPRSVISTSSIDYAVDELMATLYHRVPMVAPGLERVGIGEWTTDWTPRSVIDVNSGVTQKLGFVLYPASGAEGVFTRFPSREIPNPLPEDTVSAGYPLTMSFYGIPVATKVKATLEDDSGNAVECWVSSPEKPANAIRPENSNTICIIPKKALRPDRQYVAKFSGTVDGEIRSWTSSFHTRKRALAW